MRVLGAPYYLYLLSVTYLWPFFVVPTALSLAICFIRSLFFFICRNFVVGVYVFYSFTFAHKLSNTYILAASVFWQFF